MLAAVFDRPGPAENLRIVELAAPEPRHGQLQVAVRTAGVQPFDALVRSGAMEIPLQYPQQIGNEFAGTVTATGPGVRHRVGDEVLGWAALRSHAQLVVTDDDAVVVKPPTMNWETAGAIGSSGQTALTTLEALPTGHSLLVHGGAGGAGSAIVQIACHRGWSVVATARPQHHSALRAMGATPVQYGPDLVDRLLATAPDGFDAAVSTVGGATLTQSVDLVGDPAHVVTLVDHDRAAQLGVIGVRATRSAEHLAELVDLHDLGALTVSIRARYPLERIAEAHRDIETGHGHGKIVVTVARDLTGSGGTGG